MSSGLYGNIEILERNLASVTGTTIFPPFVAPCDLEVVGMVAHLGTAPGTTSTVIVNVSNAPTAQTGVSAYNLWTAAKVPTITGASANNFTTSLLPSLIDNFPYALNYPLPGPAGSVGYVTAQASTQTTTNPVVAPPTFSAYRMGALTAPDNTYVDVNGVTQSTSIIHAGDISSFVVSGTLGSAANLAISLYLNKN